MAKTPGRRVPVAMAASQSAAGGWLRGIRFSGFSLVVMGILILGVVILAPSLRALIVQNQQIADLQTAVDQQKAELSQATAERARWNDPSYVRSQVRDRLYYVMPGDTSFLIIDDRPAAAKAKDQAPVSKKIQTTKTDWLGSLFGSVMIAGLTDATGKQLNSNTPVTPTPTPTPTTPVPKG